MAQRDQNKAFSEINVVPLVDVMLVLLVIFMITAPLMFNGVNLTLPKTKKVNQVKLVKNQVVLSLTRTGELYLGKDKILFSEVIDLISSALTQSKKKTVYLRADYGIKYGKVAKLIAHLKRNGISQIALITEVGKNS